MGEVRHFLTCRAIALLSTTLLAGCATTGHRPRPFPAPERPSTRDGDTAAPVGERATAVAPVIIETALGLRGRPYRNGGTDPSGFDCSGFTQYVFARHGIVLPRETREQYSAGRAVSRRDVTQGDLVFFSTLAPGASHVAIALDDDRFVHAPSARGVVRVERLSLPYWSERYVGARRVASPVQTR